MNKKLLFSGFVGVMVIGSLVVDQIVIHETRKQLNKKSEQLEKSFANFDAVYEKCTRLDKDYEKDITTLGLVLKRALEGRWNDGQKKELLEIINKYI